MLVDQDLIVVMNNSGIMTASNLEMDPSFARLCSGPSVKSLRCVQM